MCLCLTLTVSMFLSQSACVFSFLRHFPCLYLTISHSVFFSVSLTRSQSFFVSVSLRLCSVSLTLSLSLSLHLSLRLRLPFTPILSSSPSHYLSFLSLHRPPSFSLSLPLATQAAQTPWNLPKSINGFEVEVSMSVSESCIE